MGIGNQFNTGGSRPPFKRGDDVTSIVIFEAIAWIVVGAAMLIGFIEWLY
tara:strand:+ start:431 stop:580 length:150 start_codon:yes stop_codon:yes gene_type:complete